MQYLFGDSDLAAYRLKVLADVYAESTRNFVLDAVIERPRLAVDMGCGPGYTTHLLAGLLQCERTVGFDSSEHFISLARKTETDALSFRLHDVTSVPFPVGPADLLFCRFLLTHLRDPQAVVARWATQLAPKGLLLMEEVEWIHSQNRVFRTYLNIVEAMLEHKSGRLYVGQTLDRLSDDSAFERRISQVVRLRVSNRDAATMFYLNIRTWKLQPFIRTNYPSSMIEQLEEDLKTLAGRRDDASEIEWGMRQIVFERT